LVDYVYTADETWRVWPHDLSVQSFIGLAPFVVDHITYDLLCEPIRGYIKEARDEVVNALQDFQTAMKDLRDRILPYNTTINGNVPRYCSESLTTFILDIVNRVEKP
jgi:hypothetical protein